MIPAVLSWSGGKDSAMALHALRNGGVYDIVALLTELPPGADPCGEYGEFHSFVWDGPVFSRPVPIRVGETTRSGEFFTAAISLSAEP